MIVRVSAGMAPAVKLSMDMVKPSEPEMSPVSADSSATARAFVVVTLGVCETSEEIGVSVASGNAAAVCDSPSSDSGAG